MRQGLVAPPPDAFVFMMKDLLGEARMFVDRCDSGWLRLGVVLRRTALCADKGDEGKVRGSGDVERLLVVAMIVAMLLRRGMLFENNPVSRPAMLL